jgi:ribosomal protein S18 acetylase RimI-like enzyme
MSLQETAPQIGRRATKFSAANVQRIKDFVAQGLSREEIAKSLDVTLGSLQVTCSRLGISLRKRHVLNGNPSYSRVMNGNGRHHDVPNHPPMVGRKRASWQFQMDCNGARRTTDLPFTDSGIAQLAVAAEARNLGMGQLLTETVVTAIKKNMVKRILRELSPNPAPQAVPESP